MFRLIESVIWFILKPTLFVLFLAVLIFHAGTTLAYQENPHEAESGAFFLSHNKSTVRAINHNSHADLDITGMVAKVTLTQEFYNQTDAWVEGVYVFPLPENSAVNFMAMHIGERRIVAKIKEKQEAKKIYQKAKSEGKKAALTVQQRPNIFTQKVANIPPGESIKVEIRYLQTVHYDMGKFSLRFPMTITPRYMPGNTLKDFNAEESFSGNVNGWALPTSQVSDAQKISPYYNKNNANSISFTILLDGGLDLETIASPSHSVLSQRINNSQYRVRTQQPSIKMDRDFELSWSPGASQSPKAAIFHEKLNQHSFIQLMMLPPQVASSDYLEARELILIVDTSGSMQGNSIVQARESVKLALQQLRANDSFNLIEFDSNHRLFRSNAVSASPENIRSAIAFVESLKADGGTNMAPAIEAALNMPGTEKLKQIVFITDGSVGNENQLFKLIHQKLGNARFFTVGIGSAPNSFFMRKAAQFGRGTFTHIGSAQQVSERMLALFQKLESPVITNLKVQWPDGLYEEVYPSRVPDLYLGEPLLVSAKFANSPTHDEQIVISGNLAGSPWTRKISVPQPKQTSIVEEKPKSSGIATFWARGKIEHLMDLKTMGEDENKIKPQIIATAVEHQLMSAYTSFVAVEEELSRPASEALKSSAVSLNKPHGQTLPTQAYPATATPAMLNIILGATSFILFILLRLRGRNER